MASFGSGFATGGQSPQPTSRPPQGGDVIYPGGTPDWRNVGRQPAPGAPKPGAASPIPAAGTGTPYGKSASLPSQSVPNDAAFSQFYGNLKTSNPQMARDPLRSMRSAGDQWNKWTPQQREFYAKRQSEQAGATAGMLAAWGSGHKARTDSVAEYNKAMGAYAPDDVAGRQGAMWDHAQKYGGWDDQSTQLTKQAREMSRDDFVAMRQGSLASTAKENARIEGNKQARIDNFRNLQGMTPEAADWLQAGGVSTPSESVYNTLSQYGGFRELTRGKDYNAALREQQTRQGLAQSDWEQRNRGVRYPGAGPQASSFWGGAIGGYTPDSAIDRILAVQ